MTDSQTDGRTLAARYLKGLNDRDPDAVDGFVAVDYINHNPFVENGREANRAFWSSIILSARSIIGRAPPPRSWARRPAACCVARS